MANVQIRTVAVPGRTANTLTTWYEPTPSKSYPQERQSVTITPEGVSVDEKIAHVLVSMNEDIDYVAKTKRVRPHKHKD